MNAIETPLKFYRVTDLSGLSPHVERLIQMMKKVAAKSGNTEAGVNDDLMKAVTCLERDPDFALWLVMDSRGVRGFAFAQILVNGGRRECFIWQAYVERRDAIGPGIEIVKSWALRHHAKIVYFSTARNPLAYSRRLKAFGFGVRSTIFSANAEQRKSDRHGTIVHPS